ncbi:MAG: glycosyltransferase family 1 protein [Patescibacteria group bacterium]|nr:glycosyltransferase family 4 protein [Patescibacteria group bacterium]
MTIAFDLRAIMRGNVSGVETYTKSLLDELLKIDKENTYILYTNSHRDISANIPKYENENVIYVNTHIPSRLFNLSLRLFKYPKIDKIIKKECGKDVDIFFCPDPRPTPLSKAKKITVIHDLCFKHFPEYFSRKSRIWFKYVLGIEREIKSSNKLIAVSAYTKEDLVREYNVDPKKIAVTHEGGGEHLKVQTNEEVILRKYKLPKNYYLMLSTIEPRKNTNNVIKAFKKANLKDMTLVVAGRKNKRIFSDYKTITGENIQYIGFVDEDDKSALLKNAKGFIYLSLFEGFGLPATEAMYFHTPTLVSNTTSLLEIGKDHAMLANPENIDEIAEKLKTLQFHKQERPPYSWEKCAKETLDIINRVSA